jgi:hypothetical protein
MGQTEGATLALGELKDFLECCSISKIRIGTLSNPHNGSSAYVVLLCNVVTAEPTDNEGEKLGVRLLFDVAVAPKLSENGSERRICRAIANFPSLILSRTSVLRILT